MTIARTNTKSNVTLWIIQGILAALFLFAGISKLVMPVEAMTSQIHLPGLFLRFIGIFETLGALGLVLPGLLKIRPELTSLAAGGLVVIMIGATSLTLTTPTPVGALFPFIVGLLAAYVAYGRLPIAPRFAIQVSR
jgi:uncharacterized membrane protein YphA (DoxX/SURF4 family)